MINKPIINHDDIKSFDSQIVIAFDIIEDNRTKYLLAHAKVEGNNIQNVCEVATKDANSNKEILFSNFSLTKAIEFYNNLK